LPARHLRQRDALGTAGVKALAPSDELLAEFQARKRALMRAGANADAAHAEAHRTLGYRERFLGEIRGRPDALAALRQLIAEARTGDVYLMCMRLPDARARVPHLRAPRPPRWTSRPSWPTFRAGSLTREPPAGGGLDQAGDQRPRRGTIRASGNV
jgi:hypothetical protein